MSSESYEDYENVSVQIEIFFLSRETFSKYKPTQFVHLPN
jgi:hypothetical protein